MVTKKISLLLAACVLVAALAGCGSNNGAVNADMTSATANASNDVPSALPGSGDAITSSTAVSYPLTTYSYDADESDGYRIHLTYNIGKWVSESDTALLNAAWQSVGGVGDMPLHRGDNAFTDGSGGVFSLNEQDIAFVFGTLQCQNATGVAISPGTDLRINTGIKISQMPNGASFKIGPLAFVWNSTVVVPSAVALTGQLDDFFGSDLTYTMNSNLLGVIPFAFAVGCSPTPDAPKRLTSFISDVIFTFSNDNSGTTFTIGNTWGGSVSSSS